MFSNLNWWEIGVLLLAALFIFGDKLPQMISEGLRMLRNLRRMAHNATTDLGRELGTDLQLEDLHPRTFVRKHLLSEQEQDELTRPLKGVSDDLARHTRGVGEQVKDAGDRLARSGAEPRPRSTRDPAQESEPGSEPGPEPGSSRGAMSPHRRSCDDIT